MMRADTLQPGNNPSYWQLMWRASLHTSCRQEESHFDTRDLSVTLPLLQGEASGEGKHPFSKCCHEKCPLLGKVLSKRGHHDVWWVDGQGILTRPFWVIQAVQSWQPHSMTPVGNFTTLWYLGVYCLLLIHSSRASSLSASAFMAAELCTWPSSAAICTASTTF